MKIISYIKQNKSVWVLTVCMLVILGISLLLSFSHVRVIDHRILTMSNWFDDHKHIVIFCHILVLSAIYYVWGCKINQLKKAHDLSLEVVRAITKRKYFSVLLVTVLDVFVLWLLGS